MTIADLLRDLIAENRRLTLEIERLKAAAAEPGDSQPKN